MGNQYTEAKKKGLKKGDAGWPKYSDRGPSHPHTKQAISQGMILRRLHQIIEDSPNETAVVAASRTLLDKIMPNLSAVDSTTRDLTEKMNEGELVSRLRQLIEDNPEMVSKILGDSARGKTLTEVKKSA